MVLGYNRIMVFRVTFSVLIAVLCAAGCGPKLDVESALRVTQVSSGWFDTGLDSLGRNKLVPTVSFRLENMTQDQVSYLQLLGKFRRQNEEEEWGNAFIRVVGTEGLEAGQATDLMRLESERGYTGEQSRAEMFSHGDFVDVTIELFVKHRAEQWAYLDSVDVARSLLTE